MELHMNTDTIEKDIVLRAPRARVRNALTNAEEFCQWFGVKMNGAFSPGARVTGQILMKQYSHVTLEIVIDRVQPQDLFSYRWHPYAVDLNADYSSEPM